MKKVKFILLLIMTLLLPASLPAQQTSSLSVNGSQDRHSLIITSSANSIRFVPGTKYSDTIEERTTLDVLINATKAIFAISLLLLLIFEILKSQENVGDRKKVSFKKVHVKGYQPEEPGLDEQGQWFRPSRKQRSLGIVGLLLGYPGSLFFIFLLIALYYDIIIVIGISILSLAFFVLAIHGTQYLIRSRERFILDENGIQGHVRRIPSGGYWKRCKPTRMHSFDLKWSEIDAATLEIVYVGIYKEYVISFYNRSNEEVPLARLDLAFFGEPRQLIDYINYYYAQSHNALPSECALIRPLAFNVFI